MNFWPVVRVTKGTPGWTHKILCFHTMAERIPSVKIREFICRECLTHFKEERCVRGVLVPAKAQLCPEESLATQFIGHPNSVRQLQDTPKKIGPRQPLLIDVADMTDMRHPRLFVEVNHG